MNDERHTQSSTSRRNILTGVGTLTLTSLSGCAQKYLTPTEEPEPTSKFDRVTLRKLPPDFPHDHKTTAIPSADLIKEFGLNHRQQLRITRPGNTISKDYTSALYTTRTDTDLSQTQKKTIWLTESGLNRINATDGWLVNVNRIAPNQNIQTKSEAKEGKDCIEQVLESDNELIALAPHGGEMSPYTDEQAMRIAAEIGETAWTVLGYGDANERWKMSPEQIHPASYPKLGDQLGYDGDERELTDYQYDTTYDVAILLVGTEKRGIYIGGLSTDEKKFKVRDALADALSGQQIPISVIHTGKLSATDPKNLANRVSDDGHNGIQIAQGQDVLDNHWMTIADALISVYEDI